jgi:hypothetical protein
MLICICVSGLPSFFAVMDGCLFVDRALSLIEVSAFRLPRTEKALVIGRAGFEDVPWYFVLVDSSQGNSGGEDGGLDATKGSSEKTGLSLLIGVDDGSTGGVEVGGSSAMFKVLFFQADSLVVKIEVNVVLSESARTRLTRFGLGLNLGLTLAGVPTAVADLHMPTIPHLRACLHVRLTTTVGR